MFHLVKTKKQRYSERVFFLYLMMNHTALAATDPAIFQILQHEEQRQREGIELIPSENYASQAVIETTGSHFTNKYSEGYPKKRYYGGQEYIDEMEILAIERAKKLFGAEHANVQPYSGSPMNAEVYFGLLEFGDSVMGMKLQDGGHITHGLPISFSGKAYSFTSYGVDSTTGRIDYDEVERIAKECQPKMIISGATAYPRKIDFKRMKEIADSVGALSMADISHISGLIVSGLHQNPVELGYDVVTTTTHKTLRGPRGGLILCLQKHAKAIDRAVFPGMQGGPHDHVNAAKAVAFHEASKTEFKEYAAQIIRNAQKLGEELVRHGFDLVSGGTDTHLLLMNLTNKGITGIQAEDALDNAGITLNKNTVPGETRSPFDPSGIRFGTPAVTTRGMKEPEMELIAGWMNTVLSDAENTDVQNRVRAELKEMTAKFPVPGLG